MGLQAPFPIAFGAGKLSGTNRSRPLNKGKAAAASDPPGPPKNLRSPCARFFLSFPLDRI